MKNLLILILFFYSNFYLLNAQWEACNNGITGDQINCFIIDGNNTYAGIDGGLFKTTDNGDSWTSKNIGLKGVSGLAIKSLSISGENIFAGTWFDGIFLSTNKGENWVQRSNGLPFWIVNGFDTVFKQYINIIFINGNNIFAGTDKGIYISTNNGENWTSKNYGLPQFDTLKRDVYSMAVSGNNIFVGTRFGVFMTSDNGENWFPKNKVMENWTVYTLAINGNNIFAGTRYGIFLSTNNGEDWNNIGLKDTLISTIIIKGNNIFASGPGVYLSTDNRNNWTPKNSGLANLAVTSIIINSDYIFAGTNNSGIYRAKLSDLGITDVIETEQTNDYVIYPNPASNELRLKFQTPFETTVQINIFDYLGNKVLSQALQCTEGTNEININCEKLPQGYYFVKINVNDIVETVPLVIVK